jgi:hypothetical protein
MSGGANAPAADAGATPGPSVPPPVVVDPPPGPIVCRSDQDCRLVADYCTGCDCRALGRGEPDPVCAGPGVQCFANPCLNQAAACVAGRCVPQREQQKCDDTVLAGDDTTCKSTGQWKQFAYDACRARGLELTYYGTGGGDCGPDQTHQVKYTCCTAAPPPPPSPPPPPGPTPPPSACFGSSDGGPTSCKPPALWKQYASDACAKAGLTLIDIAYSDDCGNGNYRYMKYSCCTK